MKKGEYIMAIVRPFKALRPEPQYAENVISLPYDVMNREEAAKMAEGNPCSFLHICRSEIDLPQQENPYDPTVYEKAKSNIQDFLNNGVLIREKKPAFYIYRQIMDGREQTGIVGCASIDDYQNEIIKKHELTREDKELDRINHFDVCNANTEPVFFTYKKNERINEIVFGCTNCNRPVYDLVTDDGISHILWVIDDEKVCEEITALFAGIDYLYIADGHHRSASAAKVGMKRRQENPNYTGDEEFNYFMAVIFPDEDLKVFDYNRVVKDTNGYSEDILFQLISQKFELLIPGPKEPFAPKERHTFGMFLNGTWYKLIAKPEFIDENDPIASLDVSILQDSLLGPILGIGDPRTDKRIDFVGGIRGLKELESRVATDMQIAFSLYPVTIDELIKVADAGLLMPPKSTWFEPKLGSGLFMHEL